MVPPEFSLTQKINLFFMSLINIPPNRFYLIVACLKDHSGLGCKEQPKQMATEHNLNEKTSGFSRLHKTNCKTL